MAGNAALPEGFVELPPIVYDGDPMWVPEEPAGVAAAFNPANPWYGDGGESAAFCIPGRARLATFITPDLVVGGQRAAYFGYWETTGDPEADDAIFDAARAWARERGAHALFGPINFTTFGQYRLRLGAADGGYTFAGEPYNPPYYPDILERRGFTRAAEALTQITEGPLASMVKQARLPDLQKVLDRGFRLEPLSHEMWLSRLPELHVIIDVMFRQNWGYSPLSFDVFARACGEKFIRKTCPRVSTIAFAPDGDIAGFFLVYPHWGPIITQEAGAARVSLDELDYDTHFPQLAETGKLWGVPKTSANVPAYQGQGLFTALATQLVVAGEDIYTRWYGALIGAQKFNRNYGDGIADDSRWYAVFGQPL